MAHAAILHRAPWAVRSRPLRSAFPAPVAYGYSAYRTSRRWIVCAVGRPRLAESAIHPANRALAGEDGTTRQRNSAHLCAYRDGHLARAHLARGGRNSISGRAHLLPPPRRNPRNKQRGCAVSIDLLFTR